MVIVDLYSKADCCLCDDAKVVLRRVQAQVPFDLREVDIEADATLKERFGAQIPVIYIDGFKAFKYRVDEAELRRKLTRPKAAV